MGQVSATPETGAALRRARQIRVCIWIILGGTALDVVGDLVDLATMARLRAVVATHGWGRVPAEALEGIVPPSAVPLFLALGGIAAAVTTGFVCWYAYKLSDSLGLRRPEYSAGWTIAALYLPLIVLWRPWQGLSALRESLSLHAGRPLPGVAPLGVFWIVAAWLGGAGLKQAFKSSPASPGAFHSYVTTNQIFDVVTAVAAVCLAAATARFFLGLAATATHAPHP